MSKHTPGPWTVHWTYHHAEVNEKPTGFFLDADRVVANCEPCASLAGTKEMQANARLIAAAPEMLETLQAIAARIAGEWNNPALMKMGNLHTGPIGQAQIATWALAAIRKATKE